MIVLKYGEYIFHTNLRGWNICVTWYKYIVTKFFEVYEEYMHVYLVHISYEFDGVKYFGDMTEIFFMYGHRNMRVFSRKYLYVGDPPWKYFV
jgi:hypothetical protein